MRWNFRRLAAAGFGLALAAGLTVAVAAAAQAESNGGVRVMPLGDSITDGFNVPGGYRIKLWHAMASGGYSVDFVGSEFNGPPSLGDHDHEGHSGWRIRDLDANIVGWLRNSAPRAILLHIGTNDIGGNDDIANAPARLSALIDKIRVNAPMVQLFVAQLIPRSDPTQEAQSQTFNAAIPGIVAQKGPMTHLVDMHTGFTTADLADGLHPNASGYDKMAARWFAALQSVPCCLTPYDPTQPHIDSTKVYGPDDVEITAVNGQIPVTVGVRYTVAVHISFGTGPNYTAGLEVNPSLHVPASLNLINRVGCTGYVPITVAHTRRYAFTPSEPGLFPLGFQFRDIGPPAGTGNAFNPDCGILVSARILASKPE